MFGLTAVTVDFGATRALDDVSIELAAGQITALVGGDGAGKTTALRALLRRVALTSGSAAAPEPEQLGYQPATSGVWASLSVDQNLDFAGEAYRMAPAHLAARKSTVLEVAGLTEARTRLGSQLSGGMRQKLGFCMAILHEPELLLLDEPSTGVDPVSRVELWRMVAEAAAAGTTVCMTTTYLDEAERASTVVALDAGQVLASGDAASVRATVPGIITVSGSRPMSAPGRTWRRGVEFHSWTPDAPNDEEHGRHRTGAADLEDALIAITIQREEAAVAASASQPAAESAAATGSAAVRLDAADAAPGVAGSTPLVSAHEVSKHFGRFVAVDDMSLEVHPGEIVGLLGANGAGKTTFLRMLLGLDAATTGDIRVLGAAPSSADRHALGYVSQGLGLWNELSVEQNVAFIAEGFGVDTVPALPASLAQVRRSQVKSIGLGRQRQLAFFCALLHTPRLLILDEPTSGVDPLARARLWETIHAQAERGAGVIVTTHYMQEAAQCTRLAIMSRGRAVAHGTTSEITAGATAIVVEAGDWSGAFAAIGHAGLPVILDGRTSRVAGADESEVRRALAAAGVDGTITVVPATLEETMLLIETRARGAAEAA